MQDSTRFFHGACSGLPCIHNTEPSALRLVNLLQWLSSVRVSYLVGVPLNETCGFSEKKHTTFHFHLVLRCPPLPQHVQPQRQNLTPTAPIRGTPSTTAALTPSYKPQVSLRGLRAPILRNNSCFSLVWGLSFNLHPCKELMPLPPMPPMGCCWIAAGARGSG